jgi:hypothetical protein
MRKILVATTLLALVAGPVAIAQTGDRSTNSATEKQGPWPAPVGHRQPRVDQVPPEKELSSPSNPSNREDAALDRKIKSICRGC